MAERLLKSKKIEFEQIDVSGQPEMRRELRERTGRRTVPQIFINEQSVGGFDDISALDRAGQLDTMLGLV
jgi:glutaredoxin 3